MDVAVTVVGILLYWTVGVLVVAICDRALVHFDVKTGPRGDIDGAYVAAVMAIALFWPLVVPAAVLLVLGIGAQKVIQRVHEY